VCRGCGAPLYEYVHKYSVMNDIVDSNDELLCRTSVADAVHVM